LAGGGVSFCFVSAYILGMTLREDENWWLDANPNTKLSLSTRSGDMTDMLENLGYSITRTGDVNESFLSHMESHIKSGGLIFLLVNDYQLQTSGESQSPTPNHWVVLLEEFSYDKNTGMVNFKVYDDHEGIHEKIMTKESFIRMIFESISTKQGKKESSTLDFEVTDEP
jgi:hypothetical protein